MEQNRKQMDGMTEWVIEVRGISAKGTQRVMNYVYPRSAKNDYEAITRALEWANDEYTCEYDKDGKPVLGSEYKEFETITDIKIMEF